MLLIHDEMVCLHFKIISLYFSCCWCKLWINVSIQAHDFIVVMLSYKLVAGSFIPGLNSLLDLVT